MERRTYKGLLTKLPKNGIFVFGSNTEGRHGAGAALVAVQRFGARYGQAHGLQGSSYAICTKDLTKSVHPSVPSHIICGQIDVLYDLATQDPKLDYYIAYSGTGVNLNAYTPLEMAMMFKNVWHEIPENIIFEESFAKLLI